MARFHDIYLAAIQMCLYKPGPPFGIYGTRKDALREYSKQLYILANKMDTTTGPYLCGSQVSLADATIFPSMVFAMHMFPKFDPTIFASSSSTQQPVIPLSLQAWFRRMVDTDEAFQKVYNEVSACM